MSPYISLAKLAVESFIKEGKIISSSFAMRSLQKTNLSKDLTDKLFNQKAGTFVTIEKEETSENLPRSEGKKTLRGCIGTYLPMRVNIAEEIIQNAIAAAKEDYRFEPIQKEELPYLVYTVYILSEPELIKDISKLNPQKYGIIVNTIPIIYPKSPFFQPLSRNVIFNGHMPYKAGVLLPDLAGIDSPEKQISGACQKGRINPKVEKIFIYRFTAEKHQ